MIRLWGGVALISLLGGCAALQNDVTQLSRGIRYDQAQLVSGKRADVAEYKVAGVGLAIASPSVHGALPKGTGIGMATGLLLGSGGDFNDYALKHSHLEVWMPVDELNSVDAAELKMSQLLEQAIEKSISSDYQIKKVKYADSPNFAGGQLLSMDLRVNGPHCENWSCLILAPLKEPPYNKNKGLMKWVDWPQLSKGNKGCFVYRGLWAISWVKITHEHVEEGSFSGRWHRKEVEIPDWFDNGQFLLSVTKHLPEWAYYFISGDEENNNTIKGPVLLNQGKIITFN
jgi:hypothetical protein